MFTADPISCYITKANHKELKLKKPILFISNLIIILFIVAGFIGVVNKDTRTYQSLAEKHLENIVSLADINISKDIENSMTRPVMVSKTMANDEFLKSWISKEQENCKDNKYLEQLYKYLKAYQSKYNYTTVFCVSALTGNYYYQDGLNKKISENNEHDIWYYNFVKSGHEYDLQVDTNEANNNTVTVFVNFRLEDADKRLLGVIGVGLQVSTIEDTIRAYEKDYDLSVYIINAGGSKNSFTGDTDIFISENDLAGRSGINDKIELNKSNEPKMQWFTAGNERKCLITKYDDTLGWYLVLEKDTSTLSSMFRQGMSSNILFMLVSLAACIIVTTAVFIIYNRRMVKIENTDELTGLSNRKLFSKQYPSLIRDRRKHEKTLFMLDIDKFKSINDSYGHMFGNAILAFVGENLKKAVNGQGTAARWGGDEFIGILETGTEDAERILAQFMETLKDEKKDSRYRVTVSIGIVGINRKLSAEEMIKEVDEALYRSKNNGRNRISVYKI
jgi:diguanylate cyclase (GGDEF)-like protein